MLIEEKGAEGEGRRRYRPESLWRSPLVNHCGKPGGRIHQGNIKGRKKVDPQTHGQESDTDLMGELALAHQGEKEGRALFESPDDEGSLDAGSPEEVGAGQVGHVMGDLRSKERKR